MMGVVTMDVVNDGCGERWVGWMMGVVNDRCRNDGCDGCGVVYRCDEYCSEWICGCGVYVAGVMNVVTSSGG